MTNTATYRCAVCGATYPADRPLWRCACGSHLNLTPGSGLGRGDINGAEASLWRYRAGLALGGPPKVSLGEGWTPLVTRDWDGPAVNGVRDRLTGLLTGVAAGRNGPVPGSYCARCPHVSACPEGQAATVDP